MAQVMVPYRVKPEMADENQRLVQNVYAELAATKPPGLRYSTLRLADGVSFVHIAFVDTQDGSNPLGQLAAFQEFQRDIAARCDEPPAPQDVTLVGIYPD